jgi:prephenate dehydratase
MHGKPWEYMFYADLEADLGAVEFSDAMDLLKEKSENLRILGRY